MNRCLADTGTFPVSGLLIDGKLVETEESMPVINPATEEIIASAPLSTRYHLNEAATGAKKAFPQWRELAVGNREKLLLEFADRLERNRTDLAAVLSLEQGKPAHSAAKEEVDFSIDWIRQTAKQRLPSGRITETGDQYVETDHVPLGVAGLILPWNFPVALAAWKLAPALITGNCVILKPSPYTPLTGLMMGMLAKDVFPPGVVNILTGNDELGQWMVDHPGIDKISFTGSIETGKKVMAGAGAGLKRITLELGGNDAAVVLPDADIREIVPQLFWGAFGNSGQWCVGIKRLYVHDAIYDALLEELIGYAKTVVMGNGCLKETQLGPVQNKKQYEKLKVLLADINAQGYKTALGGSILPGQKGYWVPVTVIDNPPESSRIVREEPFGPLLPVMRYTGYDEVVSRVNRGRYGLGASIWGKSPELTGNLARRLEAGTVWINQVCVHHPRVPFGGWKHSGLGVEHGEQGLMAYTNLRVRMRRA